MSSAADRAARYNPFQAVPAFSQSYLAYEEMKAAYERVRAEPTDGAQPIDELGLPLNDDEAPDVIWCNGKDGKTLSGPQRVRQEQAEIKQKWEKQKEDGRRKLELREQRSRDWIRRLAFGTVPVVPGTPEPEPEPEPQQQQPQSAIVVPATPQPPPEPAAAKSPVVSETNTTTSVSEYPPSTEQVTPPLKQRVEAEVPERPTKRRRWEEAPDFEEEVTHRAEATEKVDLSRLENGLAGAVENYLRAVFREACREREEWERVQQEEAGDDHNAWALQMARRHYLAAVNKYMHAQAMALNMHKALVQSVHELVERDLGEGAPCMFSICQKKREAIATEFPEHTPLRLH